MGGMEDVMRPADGNPLGMMQTNVPSGQDNPPVPQVPDSLDIDGEKVSLDQVREWKQGNLRQQDYTKKTQELSRLQEEAQGALQLQEWLVANPEAIEYLENLRRGEAPAQPQGQPKDQKQPERSLYQDPEFREMRQIVAFMQQQQQEDRVRAEVNELKMKHPDVDEEAVITYAAENRLNSLEQAHNLMEYEKEQEQKQAEKARTETEGLSNTPAFQGEKPKTVEEAWDLVRRLAQEGG